MKNKKVELVETTTVKDLKELIKDLPDNAKLGVYHYGWWTPTFDEQSITMAIVDNCLAVKIDYSHNY